jgi:hypothetical protein
MTYYRAVPPHYLHSPQVKMLSSLLVALIPLALLQTSPISPLAPTPEVFPSPLPLFFLLAQISLMIPSFHIMVFKPLKKERRRSCIC